MPQLGPLDVCAEADALAAYRAATVAGEAGTVPLAFTLRWLTSSAVKTALADLLAPGEVMVHEAQKFTSQRPLVPDVRYRMTLGCERTDDPARLVATALVHDGVGAEMLLIETTLRLFRTGTP